MTAAAQIAVVGGGPSATVLVERIVANAPELIERPLVIHVVDPFPPGAGRVWRSDQSALLLTNSRADEVTMYTDDSVACDGPIRPGPALDEWARAGGAEQLGDAAVVAEASALRPSSFPSRRLQSAYLSWVFRQIGAALPSHVELRVHTTSATAIEADGDGRQRLVTGLGPLSVDAIVVSTGHVDVEPTGPLGELARRAAAAGLAYVPPAYTADCDLSMLAPGEPVIVRGMGLAFVDLVVLVTEGRGGRFGRDRDGRLRYVASGAEPVIYAGSRRGTPYHAKFGYARPTATPSAPRGLDAAVVDSLLSKRPADLAAATWSLLAAALTSSYASELRRRYPHGDGMPSGAERLDLARIDRPLGGRRFPTSDALQHEVRRVIEADRLRRSDPAYSADGAVVDALIAAYPHLARLSAAAEPADDGWWLGFLNSLVSGPPGLRLEQLVALSEAGVVNFLGEGLAVDIDAGAPSAFVARSTSAPLATRARALVEARLPTISVRACRDPFTRRLHDDQVRAGVAAAVSGPDGVDATRLRVDASMRLLGRTGPHPHLFAIGITTDRPAAGTFSRPRTNAPAFRQADAVARTLLAGLGAT